MSSTQGAPANEYQNKYSFEKRKRRAMKVLREGAEGSEKSRVPVVVYKETKMFEDQHPCFFKVISNAKLDTLLEAVKEKAELDPRESLAFRTEGNVLLKGVTPMAEVYSAYKSDDSFLYLMYGRQDVSG